MKVDILGRGVVPGLGVLAPVYGKDLSESAIENILKRSGLKIYLAGTRVAVIKRNLHQLVMQNTVASTPAKAAKVAAVEESKVTPSVETVPEEPVAAPAVEPEAPAAEEVVEKAPVVEETKEEVTEETVKEDAASSTKTSSKKKNKK